MDESLRRFGTIWFVWFVTGFRGAVHRARREEPVPAAPGGVQGGQADRSHWMGLAGSTHMPPTLALPQSCRRSVVYVQHMYLWLRTQRLCSNRHISVVISSRWHRSAWISTAVWVQGSLTWRCSFCRVLPKLRTWEIHWLKQSQTLLWRLVLLLSD
jgi:hypothetical protein